MQVRRWMIMAGVLTGLLCLGEVSPVMAGQATESVRVTIDEVLKILNDRNSRRLPSRKIVGSGWRRSSRRALTTPKCPDVRWARSGISYPIRKSRSLWICSARC